MKILKRTTFGIVHFFKNFRRILYTKFADSLMGVTRVYLDTWFLIAVVSDRKSERVSALNYLTKLKSHSFEVVVPQLAIGESFSVILKKFDDPNEEYNRLKKLLDMLNTITTPNRLKSMTVTGAKKAAELKNADLQLDDTDLLIVAEALLDPDSQMFLTSDNKLLNSSVIINEEKQMRKDNLRRQKLKILHRLG